jgi:hypothetical protein
MTGPKDTNETIAATPDDLLKVGKDAEIELSEAQLKDVSGGSAGTFKQLQDMTNNSQTTAQKAAEKADSYIRS